MLHSMKMSVFNSSPYTKEALRIYTNSVSTVSISSLSG